MDIYFRLPKSIIKMKDRTDNERDGYLTTSSLNGKEKSVLIKYKDENRALEVLNFIDESLDYVIRQKLNVLFIELPKQ